MPDRQATIEETILDEVRNLEKMIHTISEQIQQVGAVESTLETPNLIDSSPTPFSLIRLGPGEEPPWLADARNYIDLIQDEEADEDEVIKLVAAAGLTLPEGSETAWCAGAVGGWLANVGIKGTGTLKASDYATWGKECPEDILGCIKVHRSHVGISVGNGQQIGGNVSDRVRIGDDDWFGKVIAMRWPVEYDFPYGISEDSDLMPAKFA